MTQPNWKMQLAMWMTFARIAIAPFIAVVLHYFNEKTVIIATLLFMLAGITDYFDGYFARKFNAESTLGKLMDPIADKVLVMSTLIMLVPAHRVDPFMIILLISRDIVIGGVRAAAAADNLVIGAKAFGKWKTGFQMISIPMVLVAAAIPAHLLTPFFPEIPLDHSFAIGGYYGLWISVFLSLISGYQYCRLYSQARKTSIDTLSARL